jgi:hypothetical protein
MLRTTFTFLFMWANVLPAYIITWNFVLRDNINVNLPKNLYVILFLIKKLWHGEDTKCWGHVSNNCSNRSLSKQMNSDLLNVEMNKASEFYLECCLLKSCSGLQVIRCVSQLFLSNIIMAPYHRICCYLISMSMFSTSWTPLHHRRV